MSVPQFRLRRLLGLRKVVERQRRAELGQTLAERNKRKDALKSTQQMLEQARAQLIQTLSGGMQVGEWSLNNTYLENLDRLKQARSLEILEMKPLLEVARRRLEEALKERRILDRLEEQWEEVRKLEEDRRENLELDETGLRGWLRKQRPEPEPRELDRAKIR